MLDSGNVSSSLMGVSHVTTYQCVGRNISMHPVMEQLFRYAYPPMLLISIFANSLNLLVYSQPFLNTSTTIRLLGAKAFMNLIYMLSLVPQLLNAYSQFRRDHAVTRFYYSTLNICLFIANTASTVAAWATVAVAVERYTMVAFPTRAKQWFKLRTVTVYVVCTVSFTALLHSYYLYNRYVKICGCINSTTKGDCEVLSLLNTLDTSFDDKYAAVRYLSKERSATLSSAYLWASSVLSTALPIFAMVAATVMLRVRLHRLAKRNRNRAMSTGEAARSQGTDQKQCADRLSIATTLCYLALESPQLLVFTTVALWPMATRHRAFGAFATICNFATMLNSTMATFIYCACSLKFRSLCLMQLGCPTTITEDLRNDIERYEARRKTTEGTSIASRAQSVASQVNSYKRRISTVIQSRIRDRPNHRKETDCGEWQELTETFV